MAPIKKENGGTSAWDVVMKAGAIAVPIMLAWSTIQYRSMEKSNDAQEVSIRANTDRIMGLQSSVAQVPKDVLSGAEINRRFEAIETVLKTIETNQRDMMRLQGELAVKIAAMGGEKKEGSE